MVVLEPGWRSGLGVMVALRGSAFPGHHLPLALRRRADRQKNPGQAGRVLG